MLAVTFDLQRSKKTCARIRKAKALQALADQLDQLGRPDTALGLVAGAIQLMCGDAACAAQILLPGRSEAVTIVMRLKAPSHFRVRAAKRLVSVVLVGWGLILAGHADVIGRAQFAKLARIGPQRFWSACCLAGRHGAVGCGVRQRRVVALASRADGAGARVGLVLAADQPALRERAPRLGAGGRVRGGGAASAGVAALAQRKGKVGREQAVASQTGFWNHAGFARRRVSSMTDAA